MSKKFQIVVADPPWNFFDKLQQSDTPRGADANYDIMRNSDIISLPVKHIADPKGCILALWVPGSLLQEGMDTMKAWGFQQKQVYVWVKTKKEPFYRVESFYKKAINLANKLNIKPVVTIKDYLKLLHGVVGVINLSSSLAFGMGRLFRQTHEICLIGTNNNAIYKKLKNKSQRSVCLKENLGHSIKPEELQNSLELMFPKAKKIELFARRDRTGWTCRGNELWPNEDIRDALKKL